MSNFNKIIILNFILGSMLFSQSILNGYGIGNKLNVQDASSMGISSIGLVPSFNQDVSLQNPSTWKNLNFAYFSGTYQYEQKVVLDEIKNELSSLGYAHFIVPIKNKYAFGLGIKPYFNQYLQMDDTDVTEYIAFGDTLMTNHSYSNFGGSTAFNVSVGSRLIKNLNAAIAIDFIFGSSREQTVFTIANTDYYSQQRHLYSGTIAQVFLNSNFLSTWKIPLYLYTSYSTPIKSVHVETIDYKPFEDSNNSGEQDDSDFPRLSNKADPIITQTSKVSSPHEVQFGFKYSLKNEYAVLGEFSKWSDNSTQGVNYSILNDQIESVDRFNIGIIKFAPRISKNFFDRMNFRTGAYSNSIYLLNNKNNVKEYGVSAGLSFNFGNTKNQVDFAYSVGKRTGLKDIDDENIQRFSIGITVGDIWFVKRRSQ